MTVDDRWIMRWKGKATRQDRVERRGTSAGPHPLAQSRSRGIWRAMLVVVLAAVSWQSLVTQTHRHIERTAVGTPSPANAVGAALGRSKHQSPPDLPSNCPVCREIATSGHLVLPPPIVFETLALASFWLAVTSPNGPARARRSHDWQSRAPPHQLQA